MKIKIGVIGYKNHALRIIDLINEREDAEVAQIYHPEKKINNSLGTNSIEDLFGCGAVIISSPNQTHFSYIQKLLKEYSGYIFCEKPPVSTMEEINFLLKLTEEERSRIYFNFNFRYSYFGDLLKSGLVKKHLGEILNINIISSDGLAFKEGYSSSWRADGATNKHSITETVGVHYIDILRFVFGSIENYCYAPAIMAKTGTAYDSSTISFTFKSGMTATIFISYAAPLINRIMMAGVNGYLVLDEEGLELFGPRDSYTDKGFFKKPPSILKETVDKSKDYEESLAKSIEVFIDFVRNRKPIDTRYFEASMDTNKLLLEITAS